MDAANVGLTANVDDTQVGQVLWLRDGLINLLVLFNAPQKVRFRLFRRHVLVIGIARANLQGDVCCDDRGVVT